jgi:hypothetical protein
MSVRWKSDLNKVVITSNFEARGWQPAETEEGWDIWWASTNSVQQLFSPGSLTKLRPGQLVNHFPNHFELTHKDLLVKNVNRYRRRMRKAGHSIPHITPSTFVLPQVMVMQLLWSVQPSACKKQPTRFLCPLHFSILLSAQRIQASVSCTPCTLHRDRCHMAVCTWCHHDPAANMHPPPMQILTGAWCPSLSQRKLSKLEKSSKAGQKRSPLDPPLLLTL